MRLGRQLGDFFSTDIIERIKGPLTKTCENLNVIQLLNIIKSSNRGLVY